MGTRSTTRFCQEGKGNKTGKCIGAIYRQYDGYPEGHGNDLAACLKGRVIVNGFQGQTTKEAFNGMTCLGAYVIGKLKGDQIGNIYLTDEKDRQEYNYIVYPGKPVAPSETNRTGGRTIMIRCEFADGHILFDGPADDFDGKKISELAEKGDA